MNKRLKITLYSILIIAAIAVLYLMFWWPKENDVKSEEIPSWEILTWTEEIEATESEEISDTQSSTSFEEDIMKDLEDFFGDSNGYENIWWDFWFTNIETE